MSFSLALSLFQFLLGDLARCDFLSFLLLLALGLRFSMLTLGAFCLHLLHVFFVLEQ